MLNYINKGKIRLKVDSSCLKQNKVTFIQGNIAKLFIIYELDYCSRDLHTGFTLKDCLFGNVKLVSDTDTDKYSYSGCGIGFNSYSLFFNFKF